MIVNVEVLQHLRVRQRERLLQLGEAGDDEEAISKRHFTRNVIKNLCCVLEFFLC